MFKTRSNLTGIKVNRWTVEGLAYIKNNKSYWYCICQCGNKKVVYGANITCGKSKSCGCLNKEITATFRKNLVNETFGYLTVIKDLGRYKTGRLWECVCICGTVVNILGASLISSNTKSCGCRGGVSTRHDLTNKVFGKLLVVKFLETRYSKNTSYSVWECKCECGGKSIVRSSDLVSGKSQSCGNCQLKRRGRTTSYKALTIHKLLNNRGIHNFKTKLNTTVDIAMVMNGKKIAIEYDEWYWHGYKQQADQARIDKLIDGGWKVLQIKASNNVPDIQEILTGLDELCNTDKKQYIIILKGWGAKPHFKNRKTQE